MGLSNYAVVVFRWTDNEEMIEAKRFNCASLNRAQLDFRYQLNQIRWSLAHKVNLGIPKEDSVIVELFDNREGFCLEQRAVLA